MPPKISLAMIVKNAARHLPEALEGVKGWADEIIIVDDESQDNTREVAHRYTDKVFVRKMDLEGRQRNFTVDKACNDWVLWLDADERITEELKKEITETLSNHRDEKIVAYWIPRQNYLGKKWLQYGGWYPAPHIKLYNRHCLRWREVPHDVVHPGVDIKEGYKGAQLKHPLIHYNFADIEDFLAKLNRQTSLEALKWHLMGKRVSSWMGLWKGVDRFWKRYIYRKGYKDGFYGFVGAFLSAFYQWAAYLKYREMSLNDPKRFAGVEKTSSKKIPNHKFQTKNKLQNTKPNLNNQTHTNE